MEWEAGICSGGDKGAKKDELLKNVVNNVGHETELWRAEDGCGQASLKKRPEEAAGQQGD